MRNRIKKVMSGVMAFAVSASLIPTFSVKAAQSNEYVDPADVWMSANGRTNELDMNATTTYETQYCPVCQKETTSLTYRVPEYTKTGETAANRGVAYSDGTLIGGSGKGNLDNGLPGVDAYYTGYHWTKSVCQVCGTLNAVDGPGEYEFNRNVYCLNSCDHSFYLDFDNTTYEQVDERYHTTVLKKGQYCQFCKGTFARATRKKEEHEFDKVIDAQVGNNRFYVHDNCNNCDYETTEYITAKAVIASYYGEADGDAHTLTVTDLSDSGVRTSIRYGTSADNCNMTSAPNYTKAGYNTVYYRITYSYDGESMTENGVGYVWLMEADDDTTALNRNDHEHDYRYLETVPPTCTSLGYERWQCDICGKLEKRNYVNTSGHDYGAVTIREATCKQGGAVLHICKNCGDFYEETTPATEHSYTGHTHAATCRDMGYTEYICDVCGDKYTTDLTPMIPHNFESVTKEAGCVDKGYTTNTCTMCGISYVSDYTEPKGHSWDEGHTVTNSTCEGEGVMEYHCNDCDTTMIKAISATGHKPGPAATCTEAQLCLDCGTVLAMPKGHDYVETVVPSTCTQMGYSVFRCADCDDEYKDNYTDKLAHKYKSEIKDPSCTQLGYTVYTCEDCGDTYSSDYKEPLGHELSDWIIDTPATIDHAGSRHKECTRCSETLQTEVIPQLIDTDHSNEDGRSEVGDYIIILTDKNGKPVFDSELTIDAEDNITIRFPDGRLLDYADQTTITVLYSDTKLGAEGLRIFVFDRNNNAATGNTDSNGQLRIPNSRSSTGDTNGTIGKDDSNGDEEIKQTFVVKVMDKLNTVIPNCDIYIGESNSIVVDLPDGVRPTREEPVIILVTDQNGTAQKDISIIAIGSDDYIEKGRTDVYGRVTLPVTDKGYTDDDGKVNVEQLNVIVRNETRDITEAYVVHNEDGSIDITLPDDVVITYADRITVTVLDSEGKPVADRNVTVTDKTGKTHTAATDSNGQIVIPPLDSDHTDINGYGELDGYAITVENADGAVENAYLELDREAQSITVTLPDGIRLDDHKNRITVTVQTKSDKAPVKDMDVTVKETVPEGEPKTASGTTGIDGKVTFPPLNEDITDETGNYDVSESKTEDGKDTDGDGEIDEQGETVTTSYKVIVNDTKGTITDALVQIGDGKIYVTLPDDKTIAVSNQTTVTVKDKDDKPVKGVSVSVTDHNKASASGVTNANGQITVPVRTSGGGGGGGRSGGGGGGSSSANVTNIKITDKDGNTVTGFNRSTDSSGKITVTLPNGKTLTDKNYYTVTITNGSGAAKPDIAVTLKDKDNNSTDGRTDAKGMVILPAVEHKSYIVGYNDGTFKPDSNMSRAEAAAIFARLISERKDEKISGKSTFTDIPSDKWFGSFIGYLEKYNVIDGYSDKTFKPDSPITRAEFAAMAVRFNNLSDKVNGVSNTTKYSDVNGSHWAVKYISYATDSKWINGYADGTFKPDVNISRAEAVAVINRATGRSADTEYINKHYTKLNRFTDVNDSSMWYFGDVFESANTHMAITAGDSESWSE